MSSFPFLQLCLSLRQLSLESVHLKSILANQTSLSFIGFLELNYFFGLHVAFLFVLLELTNIHLLDLLKLLDKLSRLLPFSLKFQLLVPKCLL